MTKFLNIVLILSLINYIHPSAPACPASSYCQICAEGATTCSSCYNWGTGSVVLDKTWSGTSGSMGCTSTLSTSYKVTNCKMNYDIGASISGNGGTVAATSHPRCLECDGFSFLVYTTTSATETCEDSYLEAWNMSTCLEIANCEQTGCDYTADNQRVFCVGGRCQKGFYPIYDTISLVTECSPTIVTTIENCERFCIWGTYASPIYTCCECATGYAVTFGGNTCTAFTTDSNCL